MTTTSLNGLWELYPNSRHIAKNAQYFSDHEKVDITIPGEVHQTLLSNNIIPDPFYGKNELETLWVGKADWIIKREFQFKKTQEKALLILKNIDTVATVFINGQEVGKTDNFFARFLFDITSVVIDGTNEIAFHFTSAEKVATERAENCSTTYPSSIYPNGGKNRNFIRKPQCSFGWDWGINLQGIGILNDIVIEQSDTGYLKSWNCIPRLVDHNWVCKLEIEYFAYTETALNLEFEVNERFEKATINVTPNENDYSFTFVIPEEDVEKWYPIGYGKQHLYPLTIKLGEHNDKRMIAFRTLVVRNEITEGGKELTIVVNDKEIFCKGANWIPSDAFLSRLNRARYIKLLQNAADANMNMIRLWGGGMYESEEFYDTCDRLGLLVWHDIMLACSTYPAEEWFYQSLKQELEYQIPRLKSHPSIALWCGDNEDLGAISWYEESRNNPTKYIVSYDRINNGVEAKTIKRLDPTRTFWPSSPCGGPGNYEDNWHKDGNGDMHYWTVWHEKRPFEDYFKVKPRFCSEFGYQSFPSLSTVKSYCPEEELNLTSPIMEHHQKNEAGNSIIIDNFTRYFRFPTSLEKMLYLSQAQQAWAMSCAISYWRSLKPYCMGTLYWQLNDNWPVASWSAIDYYGKWKLLMYETKKFYAQITPLSFVKDNTLFVYATNDTDKEVEAKISVKFSSFKGDKVKHMVYKPILASDTVTPIAQISLKGMKKEEVFAYIKLSTTELYRENMNFLTKPKECALCNPELVTEVKKVGKNFELNLSCTYPAFWIALDQGDIKGTFTDNFFSIRPTAGKIITFISEDEDITLEDFKQKLSVLDLYSAGTI